ncbi:DUF3558 domain-containing protein [Streptomyces sp. CAU 1734]|uniref:DUF3558 domain-containing protein n=1 Tax=Streptomyces sp. CAU 1734 TaxID=3140360 RepID=UPI003261926F
MHRTAPRLARILACAAVPVMLVAAGCSSDSGSDEKKTSNSSGESGGEDQGKGAEPAQSETEKAPAVEPAKFAKLPDTCDAITAKSIGELVPSAKVKGGTAGRSTDTASRGSCSWNGLDDRGVKGSQYRWLDVSFLRYDSDESLGVSAAERAGETYTKEIAKAQTTKGATKVRTAAVTGIGQVASTVTYQLKKTGEQFSYVTVVTRTENAVITLTYNGTGYAGAKNPSVSNLLQKAVPAAKEAVAAVAKANA